MTRNIDSHGVKQPFKANYTIPLPEFGFKNKIYREWLQDSLTYISDQYPNLMAGVSAGNSVFISSADDQKTKYSAHKTLDAMTKLLKPLNEDLQTRAKNLFL